MNTESTIISCKVVVLGDSGVGKSSLAHRWVNSNWNSSLKPTIGANHQKKRLKFEESVVDIFLWDTAGQEQFRSLAPVYTRSASAVIIVASIVDINTFDNIPSWIDIVKTTSDELPPMILAVNKSDLQEKCIAEEEIYEKYKSQFKGVFIVSAYSGEEVDNAFMCASEAAYNFHIKFQHGISSRRLSAALPEKKGCC